MNLNKTKNVYVLASHSHFYMKGIFDNQPVGNRLDGWIVGTAGAVRYPLPPRTQSVPDAIENHYGYLLGTVQPDARINFDFQDVTEADVPRAVRRQYPDTLISWCFAKNSHTEDPDSEETANRCKAPVPRPISTMAIKPQTRSDHVQDLPGQK